jgi:uncharacterized membrane protein (DUF485 family)
LTGGVNHAQAGAVRVPRGQTCSNHGTLGGEEMTQTQEPAPGRGTIDWIAAERSPEFRELIRKRRAFVLPATIFYLAWFFGFILLTAYAEDFMAESVIDGLTVGYCLALSQFIMVWGLTAVYLKKADRDFDPLARKAAQVAIEAGRGTPDDGVGR